MAAPAVPVDDAPVVPSVDAWRAMTADERQRFIDEANAVLNQAAEAMGEGRPHFRAKTRLVDALDLYFRTRLGRRSRGTRP